MRAVEVTRAIVVSVVGWVTMVWLQPLLYSSRRSPFYLDSVSDVSEWIDEYYRVGLGIVLVSSTLAAVIWLVTTAIIPPPGGAVDVQRWRLFWFLLMLFPISGTGVAVSFFLGGVNALFSLTSFYVLDILLLYWLPTVISTPGFYRYVPPGGLIIRQVSLFD